MKIEFNLLENALDSLNRAIDLLAWHDEPNEAKRLKHAILNVSHGIELLLKERLRRIHPSLIWENVDKYPSLAARTVGVDTALGRLTNIGGVAFSASDVTLIRSLRDTRNAIEHYAWSTTVHEANTIVGKALGFAVFFSEKYLSYEFFGYRSRKDDTFEQLLEQHPAFAKAYRERYEETAAAAGEFNVLCEFCNALAVDPAGGSCKLCGHWNPIELDDSEDVPF